MELMGYTATTNPMGAGKWLAGDYSTSLTGADLYIILTMTTWAATMPSRWRKALTN